MGKRHRGGLQVAGMKPLLQKPFPRCREAISILETTFWDAFGQWFAAPVCMLGMLRSLVGMLCHTHPLSLWSGGDGSQRLVAGGGVGAEGVVKFIYHHSHTNYSIFLIKTWPHMKFASGRGIKDGNFS